MNKNHFAKDRTGHVLSYIEGWRKGKKNNTILMLCISCIFIYFWVFTNIVIKKWRHVASKCGKSKVWHLVSLAQHFVACLCPHIWPHTSYSHIIYIHLHTNNAYKILQLKYLLSIDYCRLLPSVLEFSRTEYTEWIHIKRACIWLA